MVRVLLILALVATAFWVFTIVDCAVQPPTRHRGVSKPVWVLIVVLLPVLGGILWLAIGRSRRASRLVARAPDDDPEFLERIGTVSDQDERIRRLEEELAQLDAEDDDPKWSTPQAAGGARRSRPARPRSSRPPARATATTTAAVSAAPSADRDGRGTQARVCRDRCRSCAAVPPRRARRRAHRPEPRVALAGTRARGGRVRAARLDSPARADRRAGGRLHRPRHRTRDPHAGRRRLHVGHRGREPASRRARSAPRRRSAAAADRRPPAGAARRRGEPDHPPAGHVRPDACDTRRISRCPRRRTTSATASRA